MNLTGCNFKTTFYRFAAPILLASLLGSGCTHSVNKFSKPAANNLETSRSRVHFVDITRISGIDYRWPSDHHPFTILDGIGNGCAFLDYNTDGNLDILLIGTKLALYRGDGKGHFTDVTTETGLNGLSGHFLGCAVGDYDNDGYPDIYISGYQTGLLLHNLSGKHFEEVTKTAGILPESWGTSAAFGDIDGDGKLDLFVGDYIKFDQTSQQYCRTNGIETSCTPRVYDGIHGRLYRNLGNGRFSDVTAAWGLDKSLGKTLGVAFADFDHSGRQSLTLANDEIPGELFLNTGNKFTNIGDKVGIAYSNVGQPQAGMGQDWGDYDNDGLLDLAVMTFATELKPVYRNESSRFFTDNSSQLGLTNVLTPFVSFGTKWFDADNDGWLDIMITNGHISDNIADTGQGYAFKQPSIFMKNMNGKRFIRAAEHDLDTPIEGRGLAVGDYDNDGRVDALVVDSSGTPILLHNETPNTGHWLSVRLIAHKGNRDAYGAEVTLKTSKQQITRYCHADGSYLSSSDPRVHFGLGEETVIQQLTVHWPGGALQTFENTPIDRVLTIEEGKSR